MTHRPASNFAGTVVIWQHTEHSEYLLSAVSSALTKKGYHITISARKSDVLCQVLRSLPDLLLIHLQTSGDEGYQLCRSLRKLSSTSTLPIVFVGTRTSAIELETALHCGGNEYIQLPTEEETCWLRLERHLHTAKLLNSLQKDKTNLQQKIWSYNHILRQQKQQQETFAQKNPTLQHLAFIDELTQVGNRRKFNHQISDLWQQAYHREQPISLLLCDIDYFKRYNDTYGHLAGDICLQSIARTVAQGIHRHSNQITRYGGEEFAILLPATDSKGAQQVGRMAHSALTQAKIPHVASLVKPYVSLSIGICTLIPQRATQRYEGLLFGADQALCSAKLRGRDRIVVKVPEGLMSIVPTRDHNSARQSNQQTISSKQAINYASWQHPTMVEFTRETFHSSLDSVPAPMASVRNDPNQIG